MVRTRFFDDTIRALLAQAEVEQLVILAAGMDTRAFRLAWPPAMTVYELDRPELLALKEARLSDVGATPGCRRVTVTADLAGPWVEALCAAGFTAQRPSVWLAEGLLFYLGEDEVHALIECIGDLAAPGPALLTDLFGSSFLRHPDMRAWLGKLADNGTPWRFGTDDPEGLFASHGWDTRATQYGEDGASFGRWPIPVAPRDDRGSPHARQPEGPTGSRCIELAGVCRVSGWR